MNLTMDTRWVRGGLVLFGIVAAIGCDATDDGGDPEVEDLTIVVEADKSRILEEEQALQETREKVRSESERLAAERERVAKELASLSKKDRKARDRLEAEQKKLLKEAERAQQRMREMDAQRAQLQEDRNKLEATLLKSSAGAGNAKQLAAINSRVEDLKGNQEKIIDILERMEKRLDNMPGPSVKYVNSAPVPSKPKSADATKAKRVALGALKGRGLLMDDLPDPVIDHLKEGDNAAKVGNFRQAIESYGQFQEKVGSLQISQKFVQGKMGRLSRQTKNRKLNKEQTALFNAISDLFVAGKYDQANRKATLLANSLKKR